MRDLSDEGTPLEFSPISTLGYEKDLNNKMMVWNMPISPTFTLSPVPCSKSDKELRALLLSCGVFGEAKSGSSARVGRPNPLSATFKWGKFTCHFRNGYLVGGPSAMSARAEGRAGWNPYRFVFAEMDCTGSASTIQVGMTTTVVLVGKELKNIYYASASKRAQARLIGHPVETGQTRFDNKFVNPFVLSVQCKVPMEYSSELETTLQDALESRYLVNDATNATLTYVSTKVKIFRNLQLSGFSHSEKPDKFDLFDYSLEFQELMLSRSGFTGEVPPAFPEDEDTTPPVSSSPQDTPPTPSTPPVVINPLHVFH